MYDSKEIVQYVLVNKDVKMSKGKIAAQVSHGSLLAILGVMTRYDLIVQAACPRWDFEYSFMGQDIDENDFGGFAIKWLESSFKKIVLKAEETLLRQLKNDYPDTGWYEYVEDAGHTTVVAFWPMPKSFAPDFIKDLDLL
jgi:peptidyl-tRNA hydrolase